MHLKLFAPLVAGLALTTYATGGLSSGISPPPAKAYVVAEIDVKDLAAYRNYVKAAFPIIQKYGGRFLTRGGTAIAVEGDPPAGRVMIIEFASLDQAKAFEYSKEYSDIAPLRQASAKSRLFIIEGTADAAASKP